MAFDTASYLWALLAIPLFLGFAANAYVKDRNWIFLFAQKKKSPVPYWIQTLCLGAMLAFVIIAVSGPRVQYQKTFFNRAGIAVAVGIDVSKSMLAEDASFPETTRHMFTVFNRLNRARLFVLNIISELHGEKIGVYMFADEGIEIVPFTTDYQYCNYIVRHINDSAITIPGSDIGKAIKAGLTMLENSAHKGVKVMILVSDGEDISQDKSTLFEYAQIAFEKNIKIFTVGIGTGKMALIPIRNDDGTSVVNYLLDEDGSYLKTRLEQETLKKIADTTGGRYVMAGERQAPRELIGRLLQTAAMSDFTRSVELAWLDLSPFFLAAALMLIVPGPVLVRFFSVTSAPGRLRRRRQSAVGSRQQ